MTEYPPLVGGVYTWVATAPPPTLTITGHTGLINDVRFVWDFARCAWCRTTAYLWTDGGMVEAGLTAGRPGRQTRWRWYTVYRPAVLPTIPDDCPNPGCHRPTDRRPARWRDATSMPTLGPFTLGAVTDPLCPRPAHPDTYRLLGRVWDTLRAAYPELAAAADAHGAEQRCSDRP